MIRAADRHDPSEPSSAVRYKRVRRLRRRAALLPRVGTFGLYAAVVGSALAFGAQHTAPLALAAICAGVSAALLGPQLVNPPRELWLLLGLCAYTGLQLVPLPVAWIEALSPASAAVWRDAFTPFEVPAPTWIPLTIDPGATALELLKWSALPCALLAAVAVRVRRGADALAALLFATAVVVALITLLHGVLDETQIYGLFDVDFPVERWSRGPLLNGNHLAGYANLGLFSGVGLLLSGRGPLPRWTLMAGSLVLALSVTLSMSRAGVALLGIGVLLMAVVGFRRGRSRLELALVLAAMSVSLLVLLAVALGGERLWHELQNQNFRGKTAVWGWSLDLIRDFPLFGVGRGGFETGFQPYRRVHDHDWTVVFSHPENLLVQVVSEWGIPVGAAALLAFGFVAFRLVRRSAPSWSGIGIRVGLAVLVAQNLVDFSLEVFAVAVAAVVALAAATARAEMGETRRFKLAYVAPGAVAVSLLTVLALGAVPSQVQRRALAREYRTLSPGDPAERELREQILRAVARHPGESYFPLLGGLLARRLDQEPLPFFARALERAPVNGTVHLALASTLAERGSLAQALLHLRLAARYDVLLRERALARVASWGRKASVIAGAFPEGQPGGELLRAVCPRLREIEKMECLRIVLARSPGDSSVQQELASALLDAAEGRREPCMDTQRCRSDVLQILGKRADSDWSRAYLLARARALDAPPAQAAEALLESCPVHPDAAACVETALRHAERSGNLELVKSVGERYVLIHCPGRSCARARRSLGDCYMRLKAGGFALEQYREAANEEPTAAAWLAVAEAAQAIGSRSSVALALDRALDAGEVTDAERARAKAIRDRLGDQR